MLCNKCKKNPAVYHERIMHNGVFSEIYLCRECKSESGLEFPAFGMFKSLLSTFGDMPAAAAQKKTLLKCPTCGCTSGDYLDTGFVGCADCYNVFAPMMDIAVKRLQKDAKHVGKTPVKMSETEVKITKLLKERDDAVKAEDFALAQELTDRIYGLKGGHSNEK